MIEFEMKNFSYFGRDMATVNDNIVEILNQGNHVKIICSSGSSLSHTLAWLDYSFNTANYKFTILYQIYCNVSGTKLDTPRVIVRLKKRVRVLEVNE